MVDEGSFKIIDSINKENWNEFVYDHIHGSIFQTPEIAEVYKRTKNYGPISLAVIDDTDEILAILQAVVIREDGMLYWGGGILRILKKIVICITECLKEVL